MSEDILADMKSTSNNFYIEAMEDSLAPEISDILKQVLAWMMGGNQDWPMDWHDPWKIEIAKELVPWLGLNPKMTFSSSSTIVWI